MLTWIALLTGNTSAAIRTFTEKGPTVSVQAPFEISMRYRGNLMGRDTVVANKEDDVRKIVEEEAEKFETAVKERLEGLWPSTK